VSRTESTLHFYRARNWYGLCRHKDKNSITLTKEDRNKRKCTRDEYKDRKLTINLCVFYINTQFALRREHSVLPLD